MGICFLHLCEKDGTAAAGGNDPTRYEQRRGVGHLLHHLLPRGKRLSPQFALSYGCVRCGVGVGGCTLCCLAGRNCAVGFCRRSPPRSVRRRRARAIRCLQQRLSGVNEMRKQNQRQQNTEEGESLRVGVGEEKSKSEKKKIIAKNPISREDGTDSSSSVAIWQTHMRGKKDKKNHTEWWGRGGGQRCALGSSAFGDPSWRGWRGAAALHPSPLLTSLTLGAVTPKAKAEEWHPDRGLPPGVRASGARPPPRGFPRLRPTLRAKRCCSLRGFSSLSPPSSSPGQGCGPSAGHTSASLPPDASLSLCTTQTPEGNLLRDLASPAPGGALAPKFPFRTSAHLDVGTGTGLCRSPKPRGAGGGRGGRGVRGGTPERPPPHPQPPLSPFLESVFKAASETQLIVTD